MDSSVPRPLGDVDQHLLHPAHTFPAGRTLSAGLLFQELGEVSGHVHHAVRLVHDDHAARTHHGAGFGELVEIHLHIDQGLGNAAPGRAPGLHGLELPVFQDAPADLEDDLPEGYAHGHFDQAGILHLAHQGEDLGPLASRGSHGGEPVGPLVDDLGDVGPGLHVVQVGGFVPEAALHRMDVLRPGLPGAALPGRP